MGKESFILHPLPFLLAVSALFAGCGNGSAPEVLPAPHSEPVAPRQPRDQLTSKTLELFLYDKKAAGTQTVKPRFKIVAENGAFTDEQTWSIEKVRATIYSSRGEDIFMEASQGTLDQRKDQEKAFLRGGVVLQTGSTRVELRSLQWLNEEGVIRSDEPVTITGDDIQMTAPSLLYYPDDDLLELSGVALSIDLKGTQQP